MITWLVKLLTGGTAIGGAGPWVALGLVAAIGGAGFWAGDRSRSLLDAPVISGWETKLANCEARHEKARADGAEKVIAALGLAAANVTEALESLAKKAAARGQRLDVFLKDLANVPASKVCGQTPAELLYRRSVAGAAAGGVRTPAVP